MMKASVIWSWVLFFMEFLISFIVFIWMEFLQLLFGCLFITISEKIEIDEGGFEFWEDIGFIGKCRFQGWYG